MNKTGKGNKGSMKCDRKQIANAMKDSLGNITTICQRLGISRKTFYEWRDRHDWVKELYDDEVEKTFDWVESKMLRKIEDGDTVMTIFFAKTRMKQRGYVERQEIEHDLSKIPTLVDDVPNADLPPSGAEPPRA